MDIPENLVPANAPWPIVLGIDPGTVVAGYGAIVVAPDGPRLLACGVLKAPARASVAARLGRMGAGIEELLASLRPTDLAIESAFAGQNIRSALRIGEARGVFLSAAARRGLTVAEYPPATAKRAVIGHGNASKEQVASMLPVLLGTGPLDVPDDATDALAVAIAHLRHLERAQLGGAR